MTQLSTSNINAVADLKPGYTLGAADVALLQEMARRLLAVEPIVSAAEKLVRCKGRYHSEQNYRALAALFGVTVPDLPPLAVEGQEPVGYIFKHPAGRLFWALTDERNKGQSDVMPVYADPQPAPVAQPVQVPSDNTITAHFDTLALDTARDIMCDVNRRSDFLGGEIQLLARIQCRIDNACRAAMLQPSSGVLQLPDQLIRRIAFDLVYIGLDEDSRNAESDLHPLVKAGEDVLRNHLEFWNFTHPDFKPYKPENSVTVRYSDIKEDENK